MNTRQSRRAFIKNSAGIGAGLALAGTGCTGIGHSQKLLFFFDIMKRRRSVRTYTSTPVPDDHITKILEAAKLCPTAGNRQPWKFLIINDPETIENLKEATFPLRVKLYMDPKKEYTQEQKSDIEKQVRERQAGYFSAPVYIVVMTDSEAKYPDYNRHDGPLVAGYICLAARAMGYGTVYLTDSIPPEAVKQVIDIPDRYEITCVMPLGIPVEWPEMPAKKPLEELIVYNTF